MENYNIKINYLYNSGFVVETKNYFLVFDYYMDSVDTGDKSIANGAISTKDLNTEKRILVFSSHSHSDHFNPVILFWKGVRDNIKYILSSDIKVGKKDKNIYIMSAYEELDIDDIHVEAFGSTDIGISFLVRVDGAVIFHAGDLNWWYWWDDPEDDIKEAENMFKQEIEKIKGNNIDIAFFPVDPRLEQYYYLGGEYFINQIAPRVLIPMHFGRSYETTAKFLGLVKNMPTKVIEIKHRGQEIKI